MSGKTVLKSADLHCQVFNLTPPVLSLSRSIEQKTRYSYIPWPHQAASSTQIFPRLADPRFIQTLGCYHLCSIASKHTSARLPVNPLAALTLQLL